MKYFFLSDTWTTGRVWEFGGLWDEVSHRHPPLMKRLPLCIQENGETLWLFQTEDAVLMVEVMPKETTKPTIGQVVLKRLLSADQAIEQLAGHLAEEQLSQGTGNTISNAGGNPVKKSASPSSPSQKLPQDTDEEYHALGKRLIINGDLKSQITYRSL